MIFLPHLALVYHFLFRGVLKPHKCPGCHNPETWDFEGGKEFTNDVLQSIINGITANGIQRNLCIMGGEPLCAENAFLTYLVIAEVKKYCPDTKIYVWSGYTYEELLTSQMHAKIQMILDSIDVLIDGPYIKELRDITLPMRGSSNQCIINLKEV